MSATPAPRTPVRPLAALLGASASQAAAAFGFWSFTLLVPALAAETGLEARDFAQTMTFLFLGAFLSSSSAGTLVRHLGGARAIALVLSGMAAALWLNLIATWWAVMAASFAYGLAYGPQGAIGMSIVTQTADPARRGFFLSLRHSSVPFAAAIGGRVLPPLIAWAGWQASVIGVSGVLMLAAIGVLLGAPVFAVIERAPDVRRRVGAGLLDGLRIPRNQRLLWWAGQGFAVTQIAISLFSYVYLLEVIGVGPVAAGVFASNLHLTALLGRPLLGLLCDRSGRAVAVLAGLGGVATLAATGLLLAGPEMPAWALVPLAIVCGLASQCWNPVFVTAMSYLTPSDQLSQMNGRAFSFLSLGWALTAPAFWALIELTGGYMVPYLLVLALNIVVVIVLLRWGREA